MPNKGNSLLYFTELEDWLNTCSSDTEENAFSGKNDELEGFVLECVSDEE